MVTQKRTLGPTETRLLNRLAADGQIIFSSEQARAALGNDEYDVNKLLYHLTRKRWLLRLEKAKYLILPLEAGMEGQYSVHEFAVAAHLVQPYAIAYASAMSFHALSDLLPHTVFVATTRRKAPVTIEELGLHFQFIALAPHKFFGFQAVAIEEQPVQITTPSKTLVDGLDRPDLCGGIVELAKGFERYIAQGGGTAVS
jgi:predicted transcriptional regulator of viral defense system